MNQIKNKIMKKTLLIIVLALMAGTELFAQATATATATATIISPITLTKDVDMNFGNLAVNANPGTVLLTAAAAPTRTAGGGVTLSVTTPGTVTAAKFTVGGAANFTYAITLPVGATTIDDNNSHTMTVDTWTSLPSGTGTIGVGGTQDLYVGATLNVAGSQTPGIYVSDTPFSVTVNYN